MALRAFSSGPWQRKHRSDSSGRIWWLKLTRSLAACACAVAWAGVWAAGRPTPANVSTSAARAAPPQDFSDVTSMLGRTLRQQLRHDLAVHVGQAEVAALEAVGQLRVVEAEQVQDRRVQVVDVDLVLDRVEAELVGLRRG